MSQLETMIRGSAAPGDWVADWDDVLRRSGRSRFRSRRAAGIAAVVAAALLLTLPGIGLGGRLAALVTGSRGPGIQLRAAPRLPDGRTIGTVWVHSSRIFVTRQKGHLKPRAFFVPRGHASVLPPVPLRWSVDLAGGATARSAVIETRQGRVIARLCAPCSDGAHGTVEIRPRAVLAVFGRARAVVETADGTARGTLRLTLPPR